MFTFHFVSVLLSIDLSSSNLKLLEKDHCLFHIIQSIHSLKLNIIIISVHTSVCKYCGMCILWCWCPWIQACFFMQFRTHKVIYRRYAGLFFSMCVDITDNELAYLECIHLFVEILDHFFSNVCELDLVFNFHKVGITYPHWFMLPTAINSCCLPVYAMVIL